VKIRGYRIELGEIEAVVESYGGVRQCAVLVRGESGGDRRLVAYVVGGEEVEGGSKGLREYVRSKVPEYMVPSVYVWKEELPLSSNGKLDRKRLAAEQAEEEEEARGGEEGGGVARTAIEEIVGGIYAEVLRLEGVGREDNFFELGGHSLLATQVMSRVREALGVEVGLRMIFKEPTVAGLTAAVEGARQSGQRVEAPAMVRVSRDGELALSYAQQRLWFVEQLEPERGAYNMPRAVRLRGRIGVEALEQSLGEIVRRHEVLRTRFKQEGEQALQVIEKARKVALLVWDVSEINEDQREQLAHDIAGEQARRPFDLERGPVWRAALIRLGAQDHVWLTCLHHVASDGWSNELMADEWMRLYETWRTGQASPLPEPAIQYADYAVWQRRWLQGEILERELDYWKRQLAGMEALRLPTDRPRLSGSVRQSAMAHFALPTQVAAQLKELSRREGVTLFMTLLAGFQVLLGRYTGQDDVVVGTDVANRNRLEVETLIGFFVNQLVLRTDLSGNPTVRDLLRRVREMTLGAYAHQDLPFDRLVAELRPDRNLSPTPIFQVLFVMQNMRPQTMAAGTPIGQSFPIASSPSKFDWVVIMQESEEGISADWKYDARLFEAATIERLCAQFRALLASMPASLEARLSELEALAVAAGSPERSPVSRLFAQSRPRAVTLPQEDLVSTSTLTAEHTAPLVVQPKVEDFDLVEWAEVEREFIEAKLLQHGALLFRGFQLEGIGEFERFAAVLCPELFADYGDLPREGIAGKVYSSTPYPNDQAILFHNESSHLHRWPLKIWFYCVTPPQAGGETPIVDCRDLYGDLDPALAQKFRDKGLLYVRNFGDRLDVNWRDFFKTSDPAAVEAFCRKAGMTCDWGPGNSLRTAKRCVAVADHPKTGERVFFNQLQAHHFSCLDPTARKVLVSQFGEHGLPRNVYYGDGEQIPDAVVDQLRALYERRARSFIWQQGDILMVDNMLAAHGRRPFMGPRKIVVAMGEMVTQPSEIAARLPEDNRIEVQYGD
jgi:acyl carrier protein/alpha-ketoglutarate-dependent taurine dioxygenase